jgi:hypothetical protein
VSEKRNTKRGGREKSLFDYMRKYDEKDLIKKSDENIVSSEVSSKDSGENIDKNVMIQTSKEETVRKY